MGVNCNKVKGRMRELNITQQKMIAALKEAGVPTSRASFNAKICGRSEFKVTEFLMIMKLLKVDDIAEYLFE